MKKSTKPASTPAPASSRASSAAPASAAPTKKAAVAPAAVPAPVALKKPAARAKPAVPKIEPAAPPSRPPAVVSAPAAAPAKSETTGVTTVTARIDVGFGNALFVRGEGPGLSWNKGLALKNAGSDAWTIALPKSARPILFKFLLNDEVWSTGSDFTAEPGATVTLSPTF
ncbi:MAG TPA: hypothetical protein VGL42_10490 [Opitutaceae bacterium]|jgi:hypothetical protein